MDANQFQVKTLGKGNVVSPLMHKIEGVEPLYEFIDDDDRVIYDSSLKRYRENFKNNREPITFEKAGPHEVLYFDPKKTKVGIVTCGGLCPGLNDVIRSIVNHLNYRYGIKNIVGFKYGYEGLVSDYGHDVINLNPDVVDSIHMSGGTMLGTSRGMQNVAHMVDTLEMMNINILFCIGGDGTLRGAHAIHEEVARRNLKISIAGIPKTIDNDIDLMKKSFGFETAFTKANEFITYAHNEAKGAHNGVALLKLMGRDSGFIAANAVLSIQEANFVLVPEMHFDLYGPKGFLESLKTRLINRQHAVIVVAEGAGQHLFENAEVRVDKSGNVIHSDIGLFLKEKIKEYLTEQDMSHTIKYIDPSYIIRSAPANANDSKFCNLLAQNAVHAALAGKTDFVVGYWNDQFTLLPIPETVKKRKKIDIHGDMWWNVLEATRQPVSMIND